MLPDLISIHVDTVDFYFGVKGSCTHHPVCLAVERAIEYSNSLHIFTTVIGFSVDNKKYIAKLPKKVTQLIADYDDDIPVKPLRFKIRPKQIDYKKRKVSRDQSY